MFTVVMYRYEYNVFLIIFIFLLPAQVSFLQRYLVNISLLTSHGRTTSTFLIYYKDVIEISSRLFNFLIYLLCLKRTTEDTFYQLFCIISRNRRYHHGGTTTSTRKTRPLLNSCTNYEYLQLIFDFDSSSQLMISKLQVHRT